MGALKRGLIVSCQAEEGEPLFGLMPAFAESVRLGGAVGIRAQSRDVRAIKEVVNLPVIGLVKHWYKDSEVYITPDIPAADACLKTGCEVIATDATLRKRPGGITLEELVGYIRRVSPKTEILADVSTIEEAESAVKLGFNYVATSLRGYTEYTKDCVLPDLAFMREVKKLLECTSVKMIAEGGVMNAEQMKEVAAINPYAVVVGTAITRPKVVTQTFCDALKILK